MGQERNDGVCEHVAYSREKEIPNETGSAASVTNPSLEEWMHATILSAASHGSTTNVSALSELLEENGTALIVERSSEH